METPKKKGRPKLKEGEKGRYRLSAKEKARRAALAQLRYRDKKIKKHKNQLSRQKQLKKEKILLKVYCACLFKVRKTNFLINLKKYLVKTNTARIIRIDFKENETEDPKLI